MPENAQREAQAGGEAPILEQVPFELLEGELAREVQYFPNYIITSKGRVFSKKRGRFIGHPNNKTGYIEVALCPGPKHTYAHVLCMEHFGAPKPNDGQEYEVNHIDHDRSNNDINNLEWLTHKENLLARNPYTENRKQRLTKADMQKFNRWLVEASVLLDFDNMSNGKIVKLAKEFLDIDINRHTVAINRGRWTIDKETNELKRVA